MDIKDLAIISLVIIVATLVLSKLHVTDNKYMHPGYKQPFGMWRRPRFGKFLPFRRHRHHDDGPSPS